MWRDLLFFRLFFLFILQHYEEKRSHSTFARYDALIGYSLMMNRMSLRSLHKCMDGLIFSYCLLMYDVLISLVL
jgi:hypothetical protein